MSTTEFVSFPKIPRLKRECVITEKIDGTNAQIYIEEITNCSQDSCDGLHMHVGSRNRWLDGTKSGENAGFYRWAVQHRSELLKLGPGRHYGEWWGNGIQRGYGLQNGDKRFSLFNVLRWKDALANLSEAFPYSCVGLVPILYIGPFTDTAVDTAVQTLRDNGSAAVPGYLKPEGVVVYHMASQSLFKRTLDHDEKAKSDTSPG